MKIKICGEEFNLGNLLKCKISSNKSTISVNGKTIYESKDKNIVKIEIIGGVADINADIVDVRGDVSGNINADIVNCKNVGGNVNADIVNC